MEVKEITMDKEEFYQVCYDYLESCHRNGYHDDYRNFRDFERESRKALKNLNFDWKEVYSEAEEAFA